ncbi:MAG TPA: tRNA (guanosine(37)-N1)-methyltransferase TrmD, partial [Verrucomicrobiae bacterium]|nr:tRNA (guanosine(37)-N1)-methyltransferase TrmD [Verrucomicrobiae bacterium]
DRHRTTDDAPYGGGAGMVMKVEPIAACIETVRADREGSRVILTSPRGETLTQSLVAELAQEEGLIIICGRYEGVDERVRDLFVEREISIGDYVLTGGELAAMVIVDSVSRLLPGVLGSGESAIEESFTGSLLEFPQYTRPPEFRGLQVPPVLLSGHHAEVARWRRRESLKKTLRVRPELLERAELGRQDREYLARLAAGEEE